MWYWFILKLFALCNQLLVGTEFAVIGDNNIDDGSQNTLKILSRLCNSVDGDFLKKI